MFPTVTSFLILGVITGVFAALALREGIMSKGQR